MTGERVMQWVAAYERAWRDGDQAAVESLFTEGASYRRSWAYWPGKPYSASSG